MAPSAPVEQARQALQALDFAGALRSARAAIAAGALHCDALADLYAIVGEAASVVEGADAGERAFRAELALAPTHSPPSRSSPVVAAPFARARAFIAAHGTLRASHSVAATPTASGYRISLRVDADPLAMVTRRELWWRDAGGSYAPAALEHDAFVVPLRPGIVEYYGTFLDGASNEVLTIGDAAHPLRLIAATSTGRSHPSLRWSGLGIGVAGVALLATGIALNLLYARDYANLQDTCGASCQTQQLSGLDVDRGISIAGYAGGASLLATGIVLLTIDAWPLRRAGGETTGEPPSRESPRHR